MRIGPKTQLFYVFTLIAGCSHLGLESSSRGAFISQAARVKNEAPQEMQIPDQKPNQVNDTYMSTKADYHFTLAESHSLQDDSAKAVENYKLALVYDQDSPQIRYRLALEYVKLGLVSEAMSQCQDALKVDPKHKDSALLLGGLLSAMHMYDQALELYLTTLELYPDDVETSLFIGALYAEKGEFDKSIRHFNKMVKNPKIKDKSQAWYYLGRVQSSKTNPDYAQAEKAYTTSLKLDPESVDVVLALGSVYEAQENEAKLKNLYKNFQEEHGAHHVIAERLAQIYLNEDNLDQAIQQLKVVEAYDSRNLNISLKIALIMIEQKNYQPAIDKLESILQRSPDSEKVRFYLGALYEEIKDYRSAIQQFDTIKFGSSYYEDSVMHSSYLSKLMGDTDEAIDKVKEGLKHQKESPKLWILYASLLDESDQVGEARDVLVSAVKLFPEDIQIHFQLGSVYDRLGKKDKTVEHMQKVLGLDENHVQALNYLAYIYADGTQNLEKAESLVRKALKLQPEDGFIMDTLGWVLFKQDRIAEAVKILEKAHKKEGREAIIAEHLGDAYFRYKLPRKAKEMYLKAAELEKNETNKEKIQSKITSIEQKLQAEGSRKANRLPASQ
jgi:tetratricopeptide (TPR) repeat protein